MGIAPDGRDGRRGRVKFIFEAVPHLGEMRHAYFSRAETSKIKPLNYADEIKALKAMSLV